MVMLTCHDAGCETVDGKSSVYYVAFWWRLHSFNDAVGHSPCQSRVIYPGLPTSQTFPISLVILMGVDELYGSGMGIVWVRDPMSLGVPENPTDHEDLFLQSSEVFLCLLPERSEDDTSLDNAHVLRFVFFSCLSAVSCEWS